MDAVQYLKEKERMCDSWDCRFRWMCEDCANKMFEFALKEMGIAPKGE